MRFIIDIPELFSHASGIYKIKNNKDSQVYIGRTKDFINRAKKHKYSFENGLCNTKIRKFLKENPKAIFTFEIIDFTDNIKEKEEEKIALYEAADKGFNVLHCDEEFKEKYSGWKSYITKNINKEKRKKRLESLLKSLDGFNKAKLKEIKIKTIKHHYDFWKLENIENINQTIIEALKKGYIRKKGDLVYKPYIANEILNLIKKPLEKEKHKIRKKHKHRISMKDKDWKPMDVSFLCK